MYTNIYLSRHVIGSDKETCFDNKHNQSHGGWYFLAFFSLSLFENVKEIKWTLCTC